MTAVLAILSEEAEEASVNAVCAALGVARGSLYRRRARAGQPPPSRRRRPPPPRSLTPAEQEQVLEVLRSPRFMDKAPLEIYATLLDEGVYLCSVRTMYRLLAAHGEVKERRNQLRHPAYKPPELLATAPNQVWSWDITKLRGPAKWSYFYLYVILDIFSRYVVGWMISDAENADLAKRFIDTTVLKHAIPPGQLTLHADCGGPMKAKATAHLLAELGVGKSHSRPHTSNDNPFSESQFKTLKYQPEFPDRFGCLEDAKAFCRTFFDWYNTEHHHIGIGLLTPCQVHSGQAEIIQAARQQTLTDAYQRQPGRFVRKPPVPPPTPAEVWINPPKKVLDTNKEF